MDGSVAVDDLDMAVEVELATTKLLLMPTSTNGERRLQIRNLARYVDLHLRKPNS